jgi:hypothetical protein
MIEVYLIFNNLLIIYFRINYGSANYFGEQAFHIKEAHNVVECSWKYGSINLYSLQIAREKIEH